MAREYGWTDDEIHNLTVRRFRQVVAAINRRQFLQRREEISLASWQTRIQSSFIAAGYMVDGKKGNPALDAAQTLAYDAIEEAQIEEARTRENDDPKEPSAAEPKPGTFEKFMGSFGNPYQWAGR